MQGLDGLTGDKGDDGEPGQAVSVMNQLSFITTPCDLSEKELLHENFHVNNRK